MEEENRNKSIIIDICPHLVEKLWELSPHLHPASEEKTEQKPSRWSELDLDKFQEPIRLISCPDKSSIPKLPKFELEKKNSEEPDTFQSLLKRIFRP